MRTRAIIINTKEHTVTETYLEGKTLEAMQKVVGGWIDRALELPNGDDVYVNDEGLFDNSLDFFFFKGGHQPFAGNGVVVGYDGEGDTVHAKSSLEYIAENIVFLPRSRLMVEGVEL